MVTMTQTYPTTASFGAAASGNFRGPFTVISGPTLVGSLGPDCPWQGTFEATV